MTLAVVAGTRRPEAAGQPRRLLPAVLALSALAHLGLLLPLLLPRSRQEPTPPAETSVEVVQLPAPSAPKPPPQDSKPQRESKPQPEREQAKPRDTKRDTAAKRPPAQSAVAERMRDLLGSMPAIVLPDASADGEAASFKAQVLSKVGKAKKEGRHNGIPGIATVAFTLDDRGELASCEILRKSVDPALDAEALAMVRRGVPYPVPPPEADRHFVISLRFAAMP